MDIRILQIFVCALVLAVVVHWAVEMVALRRVKRRQKFKAEEKWVVPSPSLDNFVCYGGGGGGSIPGAVCNNGDGRFVCYSQKDKEEEEWVELQCDLEVKVTPNRENIYTIKLPADLARQVREYFKGVE